MKIITELQYKRLKGLADKGKIKKSEFEILEKDWLSRKTSLTLKKSQKTPWYKNQK
jgi:hypothetical protein